MSGLWIILVADDGSYDIIGYRVGAKDMLAVFFYTLIMILSHAIVQEFGLDVSNYINTV